MWRSDTSVMTRAGAKSETWRQLNLQTHSHNLPALAPGLRGVYYSVTNWKMLKMFVGSFDLKRDTEIRIAILSRSKYRPRHSFSGLSCWRRRNSLEQMLRASRRAGDSQYNPLTSPHFSPLQTQFYQHFISSHYSVLLHCSRKYMSCGIIPRYLLTSVIMIIINYHFDCFDSEISKSDV